MMDSASSSDITVATFRQILIWPLLVQHSRTSTDPIDPQKITAELEKQHWKWVSQPGDEHALPLQSLPWYGADKDFDYSEIVYFHSYVRDFLYGGDGTPAEKRPLRIFRRDDLKSLEVRTGAGLDYSLNAVRVEGYLFDLGVFLVVVEVEHIPGAGRPFTLADALDLQNELRMSFPRRWNDKGKPSESLLAARWVDASGKAVAESAQDFRQKDDFTKIVRGQAELPAARHWRYLLKPFPLYGEQAKGSVAIKQIEDQRIPAMSFIGVTGDPRRISDWDFARIAFFDSSGNSTTGSYADDFLKDWHKTAAYDRFWEREPTPAGSGKGYHTRWLCSGYGFAVVGQSGTSFFDGQIAANFRHHYFRMGLIVHLHRAAILSFRDALAEATQATDERFRHKVQAVQQQMTEFRARFWFREVSTQLQGQEIFSWWSDQLRNQKLFDEVASDIAAADAQVRTQYEAEEAKAVKTITQIGGAIGLVGLALSTAAFVLSLLTAEGKSAGEYLIRPADDVKPDALAFWGGRTAVIALSTAGAVYLFFRQSKKYMNRVYQGTGR